MASSFFCVYIGLFYQNRIDYYDNKHRLLPCGARRFVITRYRKLIRFVPSIEISQVHKIRIWSKLRCETVQSTRIDRSCGRCTVHGLLPQCQMSEMLSLSSCWIMSNRIDESAPTIDSFDDEGWSKVGTWKQVNGYTIIANWIGKQCRTLLTEISISNESAECCLSLTNHWL